MGTQIKNYTHACMTYDLKTSGKPIPVWNPICWSSASVNPVPAILGLSLFGGFNCDILVLSSVEPMSSASPSVQGDVPVECLSHRGDTKPHGMAPAELHRWDSQHLKG